MKFFVVTACIVLIFIFSGCSQDTSGYKKELVSNNWSAHLDGGGSARLEFENDFASLVLTNADLSVSIKGKYVADSKAFVIFMPEISYNYCFEYAPNGNTLELNFNGMTLHLQAE